MIYALYNRDKKVHLEHPLVGLWFSPDLSEARSMRDAAHAYLRSLRLDDMVPRIVVVDYKTGAEIA